MEIIRNGIHIEDGTFRYLWFQVMDDLGMTRYRVIALRELTTLAIDDKEIEDYNVFGKQWGAIRGLYNAGVDFIYSAAGIFSPDHIGVVQFYGAAGDGRILDEAAHRALDRLGAVQAVLANYQQSHTREPLVEWIEWYIDFVTQRARNVVAILGNPDPRDARRGFDLEGSDLNDDLASEQNELLFRGLAKLREDFIFQVTAERLHQRQLTQAMLRVAQLASNVASRRRGSIAIGASLSIPIVAALSNSLSGGHSRTQSEARSTAEGQSHSWGQGHTDSYAHTESEAHSWGHGESHGIAITHTDGESYVQSHAVTKSHAHTESQAATDSVSTSHGMTRTTGKSSTWSAGSGTNQSTVHSESQGVTDAANWSSGHVDSQAQGGANGVSYGVSQQQSAGMSVSQGAAQNWSDGKSWSIDAGVSSNLGARGSLGLPATAGGGLSAGVGGNVGAGLGGSHTEGGSLSGGMSASQGVATTANQNVSASQNWASGHAESQNAGGGTAQSVGSSASHASGSSKFASQGGSSYASTSRSSVTTHGHAVTHGEADTLGAAQSSGVARGISSADSVTENHAWSKFESYSKGEADTWGVANNKQEAWGESHQEAAASGLATGRMGAIGLTRGLSTGIIPAINLNRSWQTEDHVADRLAQVLTRVHEMLNTASHEGGFLGEAVLFTASERAANAAESLVPQAFHGPNTPTPVLTVRPQGEDANTLRKHALAFVPSRYPDVNDILRGALGGRFSTVLTAQQLAAYTSPAIFREGTLRVIPAIPKNGLGFYPDMPGDVLLGHQFSPETGDLTKAPVKLTKNRFVHIMFTGSTGFGKSVAAERLVYEVVSHWGMRTVVLDFGTGWRKLLNAPGIEGLVDIRQLNPYGIRPLRWNPLQISRHIIPEEQVKAFVDIFGNVAQLGVKQQKHRFYDAVESVYLQNGVLVNDPKVQRDPHWGKVVDENESDLGSAPVGTMLHHLSLDQRQAIAVHRSRRVRLGDLYGEIEKRHDALHSRDQIGRGILEGIMERLKTLLRGATAAQFDAGEDTLDMADLATTDKPLLILEGGKFLDQFSKAWLLSWAGWLIYEDMVKRREKQLISGEADLFMVFEEANIIFTGLGGSAAENEHTGPTVSEQYEDMFRDSRKYGVRFGVITQSPSLIPAGVRSSCSSLVVGFLGEPKDKDVVLSALAKSEKGFVDEPWRRFLSDEGIGMQICRLPYSFEREEMRPFLFRPLMLNTMEPNDTEIENRLGRISL